MPIRILLADDHAILRQGLRAMLEAQEGLVVVEEAPDGQVALERCRELRPDVAVLDIHMPGLNGMEATRRIVEEGLGTRVVALSMYSKKRFVKEMLKAGARGYILKDCAFDELVAAIRAVMRGEIYLSHEITDVVAREFVNLLADEPASSLGGLSSREREVLQRLAEGQSTKEIAGILNLSPKTVDVHRHNIMTKLNLGNVAELVKFAIREGLTQP